MHYGYMITGEAKIVLLVVKEQVKQVGEQQILSEWTFNIELFSRLPKR